MTNDMLDVQSCEEELRLAMLAGDVDALGRLIDDELIFTGPNGQVLNKADDLAAHRIGRLKIARLDLFDTRFDVIGQMVLATTKAELEGSFDEAQIAGVFAYTRLWVSFNKAWRIRAGHGSMIRPL